MELYTSHLEHLRDIQAIHGSADKDAAVRRIIAREPDSVFLPAVHLRRLYQPDAAGFYIALAAVLNGDGALVAGTPELRLQLAEILEPDGSLRRRVLDFLFEPDRPAGYGWLELRHSSDCADIVTSGEIARLSLLVQGFMSENRTHIVWVRGRAGSGRKTAVLGACEMPVLLVSLGAMVSELERNTAALVLESKLLGAHICFCDADGTLKSEGFADMLLRLVGSVSRVLFFVSETPPPEGVLQNAHLSVLDIPLPDAELSRVMWRTFTAEYRFDETPDWDRLSALRLTPLQIRRCIDGVRDLAFARGGGELIAGELYAVCRKERVSLPALGRAAPFCVEWDDVILPEELKKLLSDAALRVRNGQLVYGDWGFGEKTPYGRGVAVLLEGPPGTGKTMAAHALAARAGLPLYKADMSALVSKYIGETEKNLQTLFEGASGAGCALFFDEADAIFSKRTGVGDSKDRYSNMEVAFLLQKLEEYDGLAILATNLEKNFDDAFRRRFQYIIRIPFPDAALRARIWRTVFPKTAPVSEELDFDYLAARFKLSGSGIKSAALAAAFYAAAENRLIDMDCIVRAINEEARKSGVSV